MLFRRLFLSALLAGLCAGLVTSAIQRLQVIPIIVAAEAFEVSDSGTESATVETHGHAGHSHDETAWEPSAGFERTFWTLWTNVLGATGFALFLVSAFAWRNWQSDGRMATIPGGLAWGLAGWFCLFAWPALGMQPELPGEAAAALPLRQAWWLLTVACAACGLAVLLFSNSAMRWLGLIPLAIPFLVGAPHVDGPAFAHHSAEVAEQLEDLKSRFLVATALSSIVQWLVLGVVSAIAIRRWIQPLIAR